VSAVTENAELLELAREFAQGELVPHEASRDANRELDDGILRTLAEMGFFGMAVAEEAGGLGLDPVTFHEVLAILAEADPSVALVVAEHAAAAATLAELALDRMGDVLGALAMGESLATTAVLETGSDETTHAPATTFEDGRVSGAKRSVVCGSRAGIVLVVASGEDGPVLACVSGEDAAIGDRTVTMGLSAVEMVDVTLDCAAELVGGVDAVVQLAARRRLGFAAIAVGVARSSLTHAIRYSEERAQFGRSLSGFDAVVAKLADVAARTAAAEALVRDASAGVGATTGSARRAAAAKIIATESAMFAADEAVQIFGGYGYMRDYPVEKRMRDAKGLEVIGGTSEALRRVVTRELLKAARAS